MQSERSFQNLVYSLNQSTDSNNLTINIKATDIATQTCIWCLRKCHFKYFKRFWREIIHIIAPYLTKLYHVRFQVLTAASMMFRIVFWDVLPCKLIVD
jgi:hypothetical protein